MRWPRRASRRASAGSRRRCRSSYTAKATSDITCIAETDPLVWSGDDPDVPVRVRGVRDDGDGRHRGRDLALGDAEAGAAPARRRLGQPQKIGLVSATIGAFDRSASGSAGGVGGRRTSARTNPAATSRRARGARRRRRTHRRAPRRPDQLTDRAGYAGHVEVARQLLAGGQGHGVAALAGVGRGARCRARRRSGRRPTTPRSSSGRPARPPRPPRSTGCRAGRRSAAARPPGRRGGSRSCRPPA